jgi:hypothetical protein
VTPNDWCGEHQPVAPSDDYTRAAVRYAEAAYEERLTRGWMSDKAIAELMEAEKEFEAARERHHAP